MIELQGEIINKSGGTLDGKFIGDLHFTKENEPVLIIGHHLLQGKIVKFPKPFAVIRRERSGAGINISVTAVIKTKIIFRSRPKPIIWIQKDKS
ncbi:unnamed protein product [Mesocestoides corti]|nr:unnamed protein product [Mesocestoides corti]